MGETPHFWDGPQVQWWGHETRLETQEDAVTVDSLKVPPTYQIP